MTKQKTTIEDALSDWGREQRKLPADNHLLKSEILSRVPRQAQPVVRESRFRMPWLSLALSGAAVVLLFLSIPTDTGVVRTLTTNTTTDYASQSQKSEPAIDDAGSLQKKTIAAPSAKLRNEAAYDYNRSYIAQEVPANDKREFIKTDYSANVMTRHVSELADRMQVSIRGFGGRVDSISSSEKYGSVGFAVPANKLDAFRAEIKNMAGAKFVKENIFSQNLLPEKVSIENQQKQTQDSLDQFIADRKQVVADHNRAASSINSQLGKIASEFAVLDAKSQPWSQEDLQRRQELTTQRSDLQKQLSAENQRYWNKLASLDGQIKNSEVIMDDLKNQDGNLMDNVATVRGTISLQSITWVESINTYIPLYWLSLILAVAAVLAFIFRRKNSKLVLP